MKIKAYLRVAKNPRGRRPYRVTASQQPNHQPLENSVGDPLPTLSFAVVFDVPENAFKQAEQVIAEITIPESAIEIAAEVKEISE